ncbi:MAG: hypothetical protein M1447_03230, partial [Gammaproteobacteria bacterium]|nr:hypothetical protein [Gammaproteobacteria bacterium]
FVTRIDTGHGDTPILSQLCIAGHDVCSGAYSSRYWPTRCSRQHTSTMYAYFALNQPPLEGSDLRAVLVSVTVQLFGRIYASLHGR